jgi:hypothetical protein
VGQTQKEVYVLASQYWGEGPGAQELIIKLIDLSLIRTKTGGTV